MIRPATPRDIDALVTIENRSFQTDRISRRSFRHLLTRAHAATLVDEAEAEAEGGALRGYVLVLFHRGTSLGRIYSIAVNPDFRGQGVGDALVEAAEREALERACAYLRLEVRVDNAASIALFKRHGYRQFGRYADYYEDHAEALRFEKALEPPGRPRREEAPYYRQTLDFTCGPASLMMAMKAADPALELDRRLEIRLWRESTTVFMTSGLGGCGAFGLALAAHRRGFPLEVFVNDAGAHFVDSVRSEEKKEVIRLVQEDFMDELAALPIPVEYRPLPLAEMCERMEDGGIPIVLISSYRIYKEKFPHWVVVTDYDDRFVYVSDPYVDEEAGITVMDRTNMPIGRSEFERMSRYGKSGLRAALVIYPPGRQLGDARPTPP